MEDGLPLPGSAVSTDQRIRGRRLQEIRKAHFAREPLCIHCFKQGRTRLATELDHILALCNGGKDEPENRQGLCVPCHDAKTIKDLGLTPKQAFNSAGEPIDSGQGARGEWARFRKR